MSTHRYTGGTYPPDIVIYVGGGCGRTRGATYLCPPASAHIGLARKGIYLISRICLICILSGFAYICPIAHVSRIGLTYSLSGLSYIFPMSMAYVPYMSSGESIPHMADI